MPTRHITFLARFGIASLSALLLAAPALAQSPDSAGTQPGAAEAKQAPDALTLDPTLPKWNPTEAKYVEVVSNLDGVPGLFRMWKDEKGVDLKAELPTSIDGQLLFLAYTIASGDPEAGVQFGDLYGSFKRFDRQLAFIQPNMVVRTTGDEESKLGRERVFTDRVQFKTPIEAAGPNGGWIVDLTNLFGRGANQFFGNRVAGADTSLLTIAKAKAFPRNVEVALKMPMRGGSFGSLHYSLSSVPEDNGYKPRLADQRVGYFTTTYRDIGQPSLEDPFVRYINRWRIEKADPNLTLSPAKEPIVFYIEHTTPIRYRRWVRDGILAWNRAFAQVGIDGAIQAYQQDARTGAHMEKDPEDARYNFILWTNSDMGYAIGPSRVHPKTGQILDADVVMDEGFVSSYARVWDLLPEVIGQAYTPETRAWLDSHPQWDPRLRLADPSVRGSLAARLHDELQHSIAAGTVPMGPMAAGVTPAGESATSEDASEAALMGPGAGEGLLGRGTQLNGYCRCGIAKTADLAIARMAAFALFDLEGTKQADGKDSKDPDSDAPNRPGYIDGLPEEFVGALIKDVIMHEVGHTLGLRHNFKGSNLATLAEFNTAERPLVASTVMDYLPVNVNVGDGPAQGAWGMTDIGPYDLWVIQYGYSMDDDLKPILARVNDPGHAYGTDEDTFGPDPLARRFDMGKDPLDYADSQIRFVSGLRGQIIDRFVKPGDSWSRARRAWETLLSKQVQALNVAADWLGGAHVSRNAKGDPNEIAPVRAVDPVQQRRALQFLIDNALRDDAYGLTPELLSKLSVGRWMDEGGMRDIMAPPAWPVHDRVLAVQSMALTSILNPGTLERIADNEMMTPASQDALTIPETLDTLHAAVWTEVVAPPAGAFSDRSPMISSLRRNLQREWTDRTIELMFPGNFGGASAAAVSTLSRAQLERLLGELDGALASRPQADAYTLAHLSEIRNRVAKSLNPNFLYSR